MSQPGSQAAAWIRVRGARTHNLKNVNVDLPAGKLIVVTGVSGSGKSSLAFDTLFAEGQRRYLECVSVKTRAVLHQLPKADVDEIIGLAPTISVDQRVSSVPVRSTLATTSEIHDYLRLLYARGGTAHCTGCGRPVQRQSVDQIVARTLSLPERTRLMIMSPMVRGRKGAHKDVIERITRHGFVRVRVDGDVLDVTDLKPLSASKSHTIEAVVDRIVIKEGIGPRIRESVELACRESDGTCIISHEANGVWQEKLYSTRFNCPDCDLSFPTPEPRTLSFNSPWGACPECTGLGTVEDAPRPEVSTSRKPSSHRKGVATDAKADVAGIASHDSDPLEQTDLPCPHCNGTRLLPFSRAITFRGVTLPEFCRLSLSEAEEVAVDWLGSVTESTDESVVASANSHAEESTSLTQEARLVAQRTLPDIVARLRCLKDVGIGYLTLDRPTRTLSGGEFQRARLAASLSSRLFGAHYVLDEPTSGLHPRDTSRLIDALRKLRDSGGTVIVVEHDADVMQAADWLVDLGPGAGSDGGELLFAGPPADSVHVDSPTGHYLRRLQEASRSPSTSAQASDETKRLRRSQLLSESECLTIHKARSHNLRNVTVSIPLRRVVCVTGVSGSGKSSLIQSTLVPFVREGLKFAADIEFAKRVSCCDGVDGLQSLRRLISLDQAPMGRSSRSCLVTLSSMWDDVRRLFAKTRDARARGLKPSHFSFNSGEGRCPECLGTGQKLVRLSFLPAAAVSCPVCSGTRFTRLVRSIQLRGRSVSDILQMRVDEAKAFFSEFKSLSDALDVFCQVGLGYMPLGQPTSTFSGGEAQRARLAAELAWPSLEHTLYVLDEPTSGLHASDAGMLLRHLHRLADSGHSVIVIEHHPDVILGSDWIVDLGPEAAHGGGQVLFSGPTDELHKCRDSVTATWLFRTSSPGKTQ